MLEQGPDFHFEISEVEITRVDCVFSFWLSFRCLLKTGFTVHLASISRLDPSEQRMPSSDCIDTQVDLEFLILYLHLEQEK